jgi:hypothetical protein
VSAAARAMMMMTGASRSSGAPSAANRAISAVTRVVVTATVVGSGPAMEKGNELRAATIEALIAVVMKVAAIPKASHVLSGGAKIRAAKERP